MSHASRITSLVAALCLSLGMIGARPCVADDRNGDGQVLEGPPDYGLYYDEYEPSFYTGFAPRTIDPRYLHLHLGRGNQLRVTLVLSPEVLREYARDLLARRDAYRTLMDSGRLVPTQNTAFEEFERTRCQVYRADSTEACA